MVVCIEKLGGYEKFKDFLMNKGFSINSIRMMKSRKIISARAKIEILLHFKKIKFYPSDFYDEKIYQAKKMFSHPTYDIKEDK